jgi:glycosyltransferase involved in cell wall biosynthesis
MEKPLVSVIIPNYNHSRYLHERIDSVLQQEYQDFELILLDDCSPDDSMTVINSYRDNPHVTHIIANKENTCNTFIQWERGIKLAQGEYIWIAESDDVAKPQLLGTLVDVLQKTSEAVVAYAHSQMIDSDGQPMKLTWHPHGSDGKTKVFDGMSFIRHRMIVHNHIYNASMVVFRKSVFHTIPNDYQNYRYCGDWLFWTYVCMKGKVVEVCKPLNLYRQHPNKVTENSQIDGRKWIDNGHILRKISGIIGLNVIQRHCLCGRWTKRFLKENGHQLQEIRKQFPDIYGGSRQDIILYEIGKLFGFLQAS